MRRPFLVGFCLLTALLVLALGGAYVQDHHRKTPWRDGWAGLIDRLRAGKTDIDSLETELETGRATVALHRARLDSLEARLAAWEGLAVDGRLPAPQHRAYLDAIDAQNRAAEAHNVALAEVRAVYAEYAAQVRSQNAVIDSANRFRRAAAREGVRLPAPAPR